MQSHVVDVPDVHVLTFCQCWMLFFNLMGIELEVRLIVVVLCSVRDQFLTRSEEIGRVCILWTARIGGL